MLLQSVSKQWGNSWSGYTGVFNWYFPISPSQVYAACLTKHTKNISSSHNWEPARVEEWNNSYARIHPDGDLGYSVIAICKAQQQWGINTGGAVRTSTLPIPFTNVFLAVASTSSEWCCPGCSATNTTVTTRAYQSNRPDVAQPNDVNWIIIGCQPQWGFKEHNNTHQSTVKLPIAFKKGGYVGAANDSGTVTIGIKPTDKQTIELRDNNGGGKTGIYWFVVGQ